MPVQLCQDGADNVDQPIIVAFFDHKKYPRDSWCCDDDAANGDNVGDILHLLRELGIPASKKTIVKAESGMQGDNFVTYDATMKIVKALSRLGMASLDANDMEG